MDNVISSYALEVDGVSKYYGKLRAVNNISFNVRYGEAVGFVGLNGAGKTTTLKMILGLIKLSGGRITIDGHPASQSQSLNNVSVLTEQPQFYSGFSGRKNLKILLKKGSKKFTERSLSEELEKVDLQDAADRPVSSYSKGMRTRLGIAHALARNSRIFVFDEPATGLDPVGISFIRDLIRSLADAGAAVLFSSHILSEVETVCDRVVMVHRGNLVAFDTLENVNKLTSRSQVLQVGVEEAEMATAIQLLSKRFPDVREEKGKLVLAATSGKEVNQALQEGGIVLSELAVREHGLDAVFREMVEAPQADDDNPDG